MHTKEVHHGFGLISLFNKWENCDLKSLAFQRPCNFSVADPKLNSDLLTLSPVLLPSIGQRLKYQLLGNLGKNPAFHKAVSHYLINKMVG